MYYILTYRLGGMYVRIFKENNMNEVLAIVFVVIAVVFAVAVAIVLNNKKKNEKEVRKNILRMMNS